MEVKELRSKTDMSQRQFASYFDVSLRSLQGWEQGKRPPDGMVSMMERILKLEEVLAQVTRERDDAIEKLNKL